MYGTERIMQSEPIFVLIIPASSVTSEHENKKEQKTTAKENRKKFFIKASVYFRNKMANSLVIAKRKLLQSL